MGRMNVVAIAVIIAVVFWFLVLTLPVWWPVTVR